MSAETDFKTLDGAAWAKALAEARKRRKSQGKRISDALPCSDSWPDGFDRRAIYLREEGDEPGAIRATMEAARLRKLADETENQRFPQIIA